MNDSKLIIFARPPVLGTVKQRLASQVGPEKALQVYTRLLNHTLQVAEDCGVSFTLYSTNPYHNFTPNYKIQSGKNLGERMFNAIKSELDTETSTQVCLIGSDTVEINAEILKISFSNLLQNDLVIGPAKDGGYYLIGMKKAYPELFVNIDWSTPKVLEQTLTKANHLGLKSHLLQELSDVDTDEDLPIGW